MAKQKYLIFRVFCGEESLYALLPVSFPRWEHYQRLMATVRSLQATEPMLYEIRVWDASVIYLTKPPECAEDWDWEEWDTAQVVWLDHSPDHLARVDCTALRVNVGDFFYSGYDEDSGVGVWSNGLYTDYEKALGGILEQLAEVDE